MTEPSADFFVSYTGADERWAEWIAWQLERAGFVVVIQAWDFRPGNNFVVEMNRASAAARRTIVILSPASLSSGFVESEWATAFAQDPTGIHRKLVPVRVEECNIAGLLGQIVYVDLVGKTDAEAVRELLAGVEPGRSKPVAAPAFPGPAAVHVGGIPANDVILWEPIGSPPAYTALSDVDRSASHRLVTLVELHLVPARPQLVPVAKLNDLGDHLTDLGRAGGLFNARAGVEVGTTAEHVIARTNIGLDDDAGLIVTRSGQRGAWLALPRDNLGTVLDVRDLGGRLAAVMRVLARVDAPLAEQYVPISIVGPLMMLTVGDASMLGHRSSASMRSTGPMHVVTSPDDSVPGLALAPNAEEIAAEMVARIVAQLA